MLYAFQPLLGLKLCWHNQLKPITISKLSLTLFLLFTANTVANSPSVVATEPDTTKESVATNWHCEVASIDSYS